MGAEHVYGIQSVYLSKSSPWRPPADPYGLIWIQDAPFIAGARPDVAAAYPSYPNNNWGFGSQLLTNMLPDSNGDGGRGNGSYTLHVIAYDPYGNRWDFGDVNISADNRHSLLPFGTIDTPAQGGTASGTAYVNFGWALAPQPYVIPFDGSTIWVYIDGQAVGHPTYNQYRSDIATLFPGLQNSNGAIGFFYIDTTRYAPTNPYGNGLHAISWSVSDNAGHVAGIGSRWFSVPAPTQQTSRNIPALADTPNGKGPPSTAGLTCGSNDCTWGYSAIYYVAPAQMYGISGTYETGDARYYFTNFAANKMLDQSGHDLGLECPGDATSIGDTEADARAPCNSSQNYYLYASNTSLYTLVGTHRAQASQADSGIFQTYDNLAFVRAGGSADFSSLPMGSFTDFRYTGGPTISPNNDGMTVFYTAPRTNNTVSVHVDAPYSTRKGRHQIGFPGYNIYGNAVANEWFAVIVYDATPVISINPPSITVGTPTTLTVTGSGFGDHPTVLVGGGVYNPGPPSRNSQGQDVVTISVTLDPSLAGSSLPVHLQSNGAGGQAFFGQPQGPQLGSPNSNTMQVQAKAAAPTISSSNPGIWWLGPNFVPIPAEGYYDLTVVTLTPGAGASPPSAGSPATWTVAPSTALNYLTINCVDSACASAIVKLFGPPVGCGQVQVTATFGGLQSNAFTVYIDQPLSVTLVQAVDRSYNILPVYPGYLSENTLRLGSSCGQTMTNISVHEEFTGNFGSCGGSINWAGALPQDDWFHWTTNPGTDPFPGSFPDTVGFACQPGNCTPDSKTPPIPPAPLSLHANAWSTQEFFAGSITIGKGAPTVPDLQVLYTDHGRDELWNWTCPLQ